jgi:hypothetical protein
LETVGSILEPRSSALETVGSILEPRSSDSS